MTGTFRIVGRSEPCWVCDAETPVNTKSTAYGYVLCATHVHVPPGCIDIAQRQLKKRGKTDWDPK